MAVEINLLGYKAVKDALEKLEKLGVSNSPLFNEIGLFLESQIKVRTASGVDANEVQFKPYSKRHKAKRASINLPTDKVDLFFTGSMMSSMTFNAEAGKVRMFFLPTEDRFGGLNPAKAFFINEEQGREFFLISDKDADAILNIAVAKLDSMLANISAASMGK